MGWLSSPGIPDVVRLIGGPSHAREWMARAARGFDGIPPDAAAPLRWIKSGLARADTIVK